MTKITVIDAAGVTHKFKGKYVRSWHEGSVCRIYDTGTSESLASFSNPISVIISRTKAE